MEAISGKKLVYLFRKNSEENDVEGQTLAFTTENSRTSSVSADSVATKDGSIRVPGVSEKELTCTSLMVKNDDKIRHYENAMDDGELFDIWEANLDEPIPPNADGDIPKYKGTYFQGYLTNMEISSNAEDFVEVSWTFGLNGKGEDGNVSVSKEQEEQANYVFRDTTIQDPSTECNIESLSINGVAGVISGTDIDVTLPASTDVTSLAPVITISDKATIEPTTAQDFTTPVTYTVTAQDGTTTKEYEVTVTLED